MKDLESGHLSRAHACVGRKPQCRRFGSRGDTVWCRWLRRCSLYSDNFGTGSDGQAARLYRRISGPVCGAHAMHDLSARHPGPAPRIEDILSNLLF
ncbi:Hypothetical predicted protein [Pelobates cultripes]|uniref:Uncharacterized protein n=1 Tax=Pelobates cultripes TaxID=61616 RepID=A0AAD1RHT3_PELCU|nr:Hypothetical predicted protein [Pelobates cultripes]